MLLLCAKRYTYTYRCCGAYNYNYYTVSFHSFYVVSGTRVVSVLILDVIRSVITDFAHI